MSAAIFEEKVPKAKKMSNKPRLPTLNTWDVAEYLPGARPVKAPRRPNSAEKDEFEERCKAVYEMEKAEYAPKTVLSRAEKAEGEMEMLTEMFPNVDKSLVQILYAENAMNVNKCVAELMAISEDVDPNAVNDMEKMMADDKPPVVTENAQDWPVLTTADGWEVCNDSSLASLEMAEGAATQQTWKDAVSKNPAVPQKPYAHASELRAEQLLGYPAQNSPMKKRNSVKVEREDNDPNVEDVDNYKKMTRKRQHKLNKWAGKGGKAAGAAGENATSGEEEGSESL